MSIFRTLAIAVSVGVSGLAAAEELYTPMANEVEQNRDTPAAQMLRLKDNTVVGRFELPDSSYKVSGGKVKESGQRIYLQGIHPYMSGVKVGIKLDMLTNRMKFPAGTSKFEKTEIGVQGARIFGPNWGLGMEVANVQAKATIGTTSSSESYLKLLPSVIYITNEMELVGTWHPTIAIGHKNIYERGYLRVRGSRPLSSEMTAIGEITHNRYSKLDTDYKDSIDLYGGVRQIMTADFVGGAFLAIEQNHFENAAGLSKDPRSVQSYGIDLEGEYIMPAQQHQIGGKLKWRTGSQSSGGAKSSRSTMDLLVSYSRKL